MSTNQLSPIDDIRATLTKMEPQFKMVLPPQISAERFVRVAQTAIQQTPALLDSDRRVLFGELMKCATDGLIPDGREAAIIPFGGKCSYIPMIAGLMRKARNSGEIATWSVQVVKERDEFDYQLGDSERIDHKPAMAQRGETVGAYSIVTLKSGEKSREFMNVEEIEAIRSRSRAKDRGPWVTDYDEMAKKTVARRHYKRLPASTDLDDLIRRDEELIDLTPDKPAIEPGPNRLKQIVAASNPQATAAQPEKSEVPI